MAAESSPAFQFYPKEFLCDANVAAMSAAELGVYIKLICICWGDESLPSDPVKLARIVGLSLKHFNHLWPAVVPCFRLVDDRYRHPRLDKEREKQAIHRAKRSDAGSDGARERWRRHRIRIVGNV